MRLRNAFAASATAAVLAALGAQPGSAVPTPHPAPGNAASVGSQADDPAGPQADDPAGPPENQPPEPYCGDPGSADFPMETRIHRGPAGYEPGGRGHTWKLDLRNGTKAACRSIHPVAVQVDRERKLTPGQVRLEYAAPGRRGWHPVTLERTEHDETIGVFDGPDRQGFAVGPGRTLTLRVRLRFAPDAVANRVELKMAAVQRRDDDGDWVGQSNGYTFRIGEPSEDEPESGTASESGTAREPEPGDETAGSASSRQPEPSRSGTSDGTPDPSRSGEPDPSRTRGTSEYVRPPDPADPSAPPRTGPRPPELAATGTSPAGTAAELGTAAALIAVGSLLVRRTRRLGR